MPNHTLHNILGCSLQNSTSRVALSQVLCYPDVSNSRPAHSIQGMASTHLACAALMRIATFRLHITQTLLHTTLHKVLHNISHTLQGTHYNQNSVSCFNPSNTHVPYRKLNITPPTAAPNKSQRRPAPPTRSTPSSSHSPQHSSKRLRYLSTTSQA